MSIKLGVGWSREYFGLDLCPFLVVCCGMLWCLACVCFLVLLVGMIVSVVFKKHRVCRLQFPKLEDCFHLPNGELTCQVVLQALRAHIPMLWCQGNEGLIVKQMIQVCGRLGGGNIDHNKIL